MLNASSSRLAPLALFAGLLVLLGFLLAVLLKIAQGSGTVSMITVSSIMAPLAFEAPLVTLDAS